MCNRYTSLVVNGRSGGDQAAPAPLEPVRALLNSWLIPNDSREPTDLFGDFVAEQGWTARESVPVRELRADLRRMVETGDVEADALNRWIAQCELRPAVDEGEVVYRHDGGPASALLAAVVSAIGDGSWKRLKACPDCRWVFYDNTRNGSKRWCLMYAGGPEGRACGTIAKVRRYRDRQAAAGPSGEPKPVTDEDLDTSRTA
jgi:predicted RNA-binding Zn ribbon-like protein